MHQKRIADSFLVRRARGMLLPNCDRHMGRDEPVGIKLGSRVARRQCLEFLKGNRIDWRWHLDASRNVPGRWQWVVLGQDVKTTSGDNRENGNRSCSFESVPVVSTFPDMVGLPVVVPARPAPELLPG